MDKELYYGIQANQILAMTQMAVFLQMLDRLAGQNGLKVDGASPKEWFRRELQPALRAHLDRVRKIDPEGAETVERQLLGSGHLQKE